MAKKKNNKKESFFIGFLDIIDLAINFLPGKALTALILVGAVSGTVAYDVGVDSVTVPECPAPEPCPECPAPEPCPTCKTLDDYTDEELIDALKPDYTCYKNDEPTSEY